MAIHLSLVTLLCLTDFQAIPMDTLRCIMAINGYLTSSKIILLQDLRIGNRQILIRFLDGKRKLII